MYRPAPWWPEIPPATSRTWASWSASKAISSAPTHGAHSGARPLKRTGSGLDCGILPGVIRTAVIGLGHWGPNYARIISSIDGVELVALADREEKQLHAVGRQYPNVLPYVDYRAMLSHGGLDAVVVATPPTTHRQIVEDCVSAGVDVLVEKPLAASVEDAEDIVAAAEETQRILMVAHTFLFNPAVRRVKHYLEDGYLGRILYFSFIRTGLGPIRKDVNALWDLAPHDLSIFNYLLDGRPDWVSAVGVKALGNGRHD